MRHLFCIKMWSGPFGGVNAGSRRTGIHGIGRRFVEIQAFLHRADSEGLPRALDARPAGFLRRSRWALPIIMDAMDAMDAARTTLSLRIGRSATRCGPAARLDPGDVHAGYTRGLRLRCTSCAVAACRVRYTDGGMASQRLKARRKLARSEYPST